MPKYTPKVYIKPRLTDIVYLATQELGYQCCNNMNDSDIIYSEHCPDVDELITWLDGTKKNTKVFRFPELAAEMSKCELSSNLNIVGRFFPNEYAFNPRTFILPREMALVQSLLDRRLIDEKKTWIFKPSMGCQGDGIFLSQNLRTGLEYSNMSKYEYVLQEYIANPLLIDGFKFDLRLYVVLTSLDPLRAYLYNDGLVRLCTQLYVPPNRNNLNKAFMHLTNFSLNKFSKDFEVNTDADDTSTGSKRSVEWLNQHLAENNGQGQVDLMWENIKDVIIKTLISMRGTVMVKYKHTMLGLKAREIAGKQSTEEQKPIRNDTCLQILGFDILLDDKLVPYLVEVNNYPSLATPAPIDGKIKKGLVMDTLQMATYDIRVKKTKDQSNEEYEQKRNDYEDRNLLGLQRIDVDLDKYEELMITSSSQLVDHFISACGARARTMNKSRFTKVFKDAGLVRSVMESTEGTFSTSQIDLWYMEITKRFGVTTLTFDVYIQALIMISEKLYGTNLDKEADLNSLQLLLARIMQK
jgi:hypothetical protein